MKMCKQIVDGRPTGNYLDTGELIYQWKQKSKLILVLRGSHVFLRCYKISTLSVQKYPIFHTTYHITLYQYATCFCLLVFGSVECVRTGEPPKKSTSQWIRKFLQLTYLPSPGHRKAIPENCPFSQNFLSKELREYGGCSRICCTPCSLGGRGRIPQVQVRL